MRHALCLFSALLLWPGLARAGNDDELLAGNQAAMMGGAVSAFVADSSAIWYDPAGLGAITRDQVDVSGSVYTLRLYDAPGFISSRGGASDDDASVSEFVSIPTQIAYVRALGRAVSLGLGYFVPQASNLILREQLRVADASGPSAWQVAIASASTLHNAAAAVGFALAPRVRLGAGLIGSYQAQSQSVSLFGAVGGEEATTQLLSVTSLSTGTRIGVELALGLQLDLSSTVALALSVRSPRLQLYRSIDAVVSAGMGVLEPDGTATLNGAISEPKQQGNLALLRTGRYGLSLAYEYARDSLVCIEADLQPGWRDDEQEVRRTTLVNARLGVYQALAQGLALGAGLFTDRSPDVLDDSPGDSSSDFYGATVGLELSNEHWLAAHERSSSLIFSSVFALRYAYARGAITRFLVDPEDPASLLTESSLGELIAHELGLYMGSGLKF